ncbi:MAG TPA: SNF2-related protein [Spirochaetota bacterium]|nr:SNF2-related protein [Spirochaetota bacterium]
MDETLFDFGGADPDLYQREAPSVIPASEQEEITGERLIRNSIAFCPPEFNERFLLRIEACLLQHAYSHNKILSLSNSRTRILAHQVECAHRVMSALNRRFLIADEVGLGKTIEVGLIIKELEYRHRYRRVLIVCPASLQYQWQQEMWSKFNDRFVIMDRKELRRVAGTRRGNPWSAHDRVICSLDFVKGARMLAQMQGVAWDAVIFDEAHRLRRDGKRSTLAYEAAQAIAERAGALLLLTATPFRGKIEELYYLIALLDRNILGPFQSFFYDYCIENAELSTLREKIAPVLIRRTKSEVGGFTRRCARTVRFELYPDERRLYDETTAYVVEEFNRALQSENRATGFVMTIFQKLLDSSTRALGRALERRALRLEEQVARAEIERRLDIEAAIDEPDLIDDAEDVDDLVCLTARQTIEEIRKEIATLRRLVAIADSVRANKKAQKLKGLIADLRKKGHRKFLIFTQFRTTQEFLEEQLASFRVEVFHGSQSREEKERAIERFRDTAEILISTEAGGEGRNMQFCNILINYDLPWSPLKIEQRIGRLHRFGQPDDVYIYNFSTRGTVAERVLEILGRKLRLFEESIGVPDVLLGQMEDELKLNALIMEMAAGLRTKPSMDDEVERRLDLARRGYEKISELVVADRIDFNYDEYYRITLKERKFSNERIERFVNRLAAADGHAASLVSQSDVIGLYSVACDGEGGESRRPGTFDSAAALDNERIEFLAFGHPVIDRMVEHCRSASFGGHTGVQTVRAGIPFTGMVFYYLVTFTSAAETREVVPVVVPGRAVSGEDLDAVESELSFRDLCVEGTVDAAAAADIAADADRYFETARGRLRMKVERRKSEMVSGLDLSVDPEMQKIKESYDRQITELEEKLDLMEAQRKWYGKNMKSSITRTKNLIEKTKGERDALLVRYRGYLGVAHKAELLCAGLLVCLPR